MRRTKQESERTRQGILAAARKVFARQGVTRTTFEEIAAAAGVTRGAIYWHFADKTELFFAMREQMAVPMIDRIDLALLPADGSDPLAGVERFLGGILESLESDVRARQTLQIMGFKCEYVGELERELALQRLRCSELLSKLSEAYRRASRAGKLRAGLSPQLAALETCTFLVGLVRLWLLDARGSLVRPGARKLIAAHVANHRRVGKGGNKRNL
ncbi:MAG TPA: TetR family transcriptional regulator [Burkholderiales bacterium]|nr:TetR family transcriptional regulator [Burkholderiales bacterium]